MWEIIEFNSSDVRASASKPLPLPPRQIKYRVSEWERLIDFWLLQPFVIVLENTLMSQP